eukprot:7481378-Ditylum_brightwellii.AAC.1
MVGRIIQTGGDNSRLGRWSYVQIAGRDQKKVTIVTAYHPCKQTNPGDSTVTAQQRQLLRQQGKKHPQPRTQWLHNIKLKINKWKQEGEVLFLVDANSGLKDNDFATFLAETGMCDTIGATHGMDAPNTQADGSKAIDFILITPDTVATIQRCGMLCFYEGTHLDH